jgi:hypothetical protein
MMDEDYQLANLIIANGQSRTRMCLTWLSVERLNEHFLKNYLGRQKATAIYIVESWVCHDFNTV